MFADQGSKDKVTLELLRHVENWGTRLIVDGLKGFKDMSVDCEGGDYYLTNAWKAVGSGLEKIMERPNEYLAGSTSGNRLVSAKLFGWASDKAITTIDAKWGSALKFGFAPFKDKKEGANVPFFDTNCPDFVLRGKCTRASCGLSHSAEAFCSYETMGDYMKPQCLVSKKLAMVDRPTE
jgi:hypothetical protein